MGLLIGESIIINTGVLQGFGRDANIRILGVLAGAVVLATWAWLTLSAIWVGSRAASFGSTLAVTATALLAMSVFALSCGLLATGAIRGRQLTEDPVLIVILQDQLLYLVYSVCTVAIAAISFAQADQDVGRALTQPMTYLGAPFFLFYAFTLQNNHKHLERQRVRVSKLHADGQPSDPDAWMRSLSRHMTLQRRVTLGIAALAVIPLGVILIGSMSDFDQLFADLRAQ
jgi:hypothetical protein